MQFINQFVDNRNDPSKIRYPLSGLKDILESTSGILIYQEQCMRAVVEIAGYDKSDSDGFRRCIAKKIQALLPLHRRWFIYGRESVDVDENGYKKDYGHPIPGGIKMGYRKEDLEKFFQQMEEFAKYSFNLSHAVVYAAMAYATAYLAYYYPAEYFSAQLNYARGNDEQLVRYIHHCTRTLKLNVLPASVNTSFEDFTPIDSKTISSSLKVKGASANAIPAIVENRPSGGYRDIWQFLALNLSVLNKSTFVALTAVGALDCFGIHKSILVAASEKLFGTGMPKARKEADINAADFLKEKCASYFPQLNEYPQPVMLRMEKQYLGYYFSGHPLLRLTDKLDEFRRSESVNFISLSALGYETNDDGSVTVNSDFADRDVVQFAAVVDDIVIKTTKNNELMGVLSAEDLDSQSECVVWPNDWSRLKGILEKDMVYLFTAQIRLREDAPPTLCVMDAVPLDSTIRTRVIFNVQSTPDLNRLLKGLSWLRKKGQTDKEATYVQMGNILYTLPTQYWVHPDNLQDLYAYNVHNIEIKRW